MIKPISPEEIYENKDKYLHPDILEIVNRLLGERYTKGGSADLLQKEIVKEFIEKNPTFTEKKMLAASILDFEDAFRKNGWHVEYERPIYYGGDSHFDPFYRFTAKQK